MGETANELETTASAYGFERIRDASDVDRFRKDAEDGSFWLIGTESELDFDDASATDEIWVVSRFKDGDEGEASITVNEALSLSLALEEHAAIPCPEFDKHGDPIEEQFQYWTDLHWRDRKGKQNWDKFEKVMRDIPGFAPIFEEGFRLTTTGGGCTAFEKYDETESTLWLIAADGGTSKHPQSASWAVQRELTYCDDRENDGKLIGVSEDLTLEEVLQRYKSLPVPQIDQKEFYLYFKSWEEFEASGLAVEGPSVQP